MDAKPTTTTTPAGPRCYTVPQILDKLQMANSTYKSLKRQGRLPFLEELKPRLGRVVRYRADLVDRYLAGQWGQSRSFASSRRPHLRARAS